MAFEARFGGTCSRCGVRFPAGTRINLFGGQPEHETCPGQEDPEEARRQRRLEEAARLGRRYTDPNDMPRDYAWVEAHMATKVDHGELTVEEANAVLAAYRRTDLGPVDEGEGVVIEVLFRPDDSA